MRCCLKTLGRYVQGFKNKLQGQRAFFDSSSHASASKQSLFKRVAIRAVLRIHGFEILLAVPTRRHSHGNLKGLPLRICLLWVLTSVDALVS